MGAPHGRRRCREKDFVVPQSYQIMPSDIYTNQCPFYHPDEVLNKHLNDNQEVFVDLVHRQPVDEYGCPIISKWAFIAFKLSEEHREERESKFFFSIIFLRTKIKWKLQKIKYNKLIIKHCFLLLDSM